MSIGPKMKRGRPKQNQTELNLKPQQVAYAVDSGAIHSITILGPCEEEDGHRNDGYEAINENSNKESLREIHTCNLDFVTPSFRAAMRELRRQHKILLSEALDTLAGAKQQVEFHEAVIKTPTRLQFS